MADSIESPTSATPSNGRQLPAAPPLRIHHLLAWMTVTAILIAVQRWIVEALPYPINSDPLTSAFSNVLMGGQLTIAAYAVAWRWRRASQKLEPGEWLSLFASTVYLPKLVQSALIAHVGRTTIDWLFWISLPGCLIEAAWLIVFAVLLFRSAESAAWKIVYFLVALQTLQGLSFLLVVATVDSMSHVDAIDQAWRWMSGALNWLLAIALAIAAYQDCFQPQGRRWTHWLGVALFLLFLSLTILFEALNGN